MSGVSVALLVIAFAEFVWGGTIIMRWTEPGRVEEFQHRAPFEEVHRAMCHINSSMLALQILTIVRLLALR